MKAMIEPLDSPALTLASARRQKPIIIHSRYACKDALRQATEVGIKQAVFHWYTGPSSVLHNIIAEGYFISATPASEYHAEHRRAVREAPLLNLLLATDAPVEYGRESRYTSTPKDVKRSLSAASEIKGRSISFGSNNALTHFAPFHTLTASAVVRR